MAESTRHKIDHHNKYYHCCSVHITFYMIKANNRENVLEIKVKKWAMVEKKVGRDKRNAAAGRTFNEIGLSLSYKIRCYRDY